MQSRQGYGPDRHGKLGDYKRVIQETNPKLIIVIDALASRSVSRLNTTVQIADTGISPGSGVRNNRKALNQESLGVKVIAIGVPTG